MQAFFSIFFNAPATLFGTPLDWNDVPAHSPAPSASCYSRNRDRPRLNTIWPPQPTLDLDLWPGIAQECIAEPRMELHQRFRSIFLVIGRKILPIAPYFSSPHVE